MWKESYRLGVECIDRQHMELFRMTDTLVQTAARGASAAECEEILHFLKQYVLEHFRDEEAYQASIGYAGLEAHKKEHAEFTRTIYQYEARLRACDFSGSCMKELAGAVTAWLIYHVLDIDQKIVAGDAHSSGTKDFDMTVELFSESAMEVMEKMAGFERAALQCSYVENHKLQGDVFIEIELIGALQGKVIFGFSRELALNLIRILTMMELEELDELVQSALCELTNISCGSATIALSEKGVSCDIRPPLPCTDVGKGSEVTGMVVDTGAGGLEVVVLLFDEAAALR